MTQASTSSDPSRTFVRSPPAGSILSRAARKLISWNQGLRSVPLLPYGISAAAIGIAIGIRLFLGEGLLGVPFITIFPAVIVTTLLGGLGPGVLAMVLGGLGTWVLLLPQVDPSGSGGDPRLLPLAVYVLVAGFDCLLIDWLIKSAVKWTPWLGPV
jgi:hypothetical protein